MKQLSACGRLLVIMITFLSTGIVSAQTAFIYQPIVSDEALYNQLKTVIRERFAKDSTGITGDNKKYLLKFYRERYDAINEMFANKEIIMSQEINDYLSKLTTEIIAKNPQLASLGTHFVFNRAWWPNAASFGEGTIIFNIGLFSKLKNEAQVVFALCHELAHLYLDHGNNAIRQYVNTVYSDEFQQKLKEIQKTEFEKNKEADKLIKGLVFKTFRHGREHESEADSLGLQFMKNTRFDTREALGCLAVLDEIDKDVYNTEKGLPHFFGFTDYPFRPRWIRKEEAFFGVTPESKQTDEDADSLKTHPDCKIRISRLEPYINLLNNSITQQYLVGKTEFERMQELFRYEAVGFCFQSESISRCLYLSLEMLDQRPNDVYLIAMIGRCFDEMYMHQKSHTLSKIVSLPSPYTEKNYNLLLEFIQKLSLNEMAGISYHFLKQYEQQCSGNEDFVYALAKSKINFDMPAEAAHWKEYYNKTFTNPKYKF